MGEVIVIQFRTLDGVVSDPDGRSGTPYGGWAFRFGSGPVTDDKFRLGSRTEDGVLLFGRRTWEHFSRLWPTRDDPYARRLNAATKRVATRTGFDASAWANSAAIDGDPLAWVKDEQRDVVVIGSLDLVHQLAAADLVDEYRLITFPAVVGQGDRLFPDALAADFRYVTVESVGEAVYTVLSRGTSPTAP